MRDGTRSCTAASRNPKIPTSVKYDDHDERSGFTPISPPMLMFLVRHPQDDMDAHTGSSTPTKSRYVPQISFMPLNLLNVYPMNGNAMSADC